LFAKQNKQRVYNRLSLPAAKYKLAVWHHGVAGSSDLRGSSTSQVRHYWGRPTNRHQTLLSPWRLRMFWKQD